MAVTAGDVMALARVFLNDTAVAGGAVYTNTVLLEPLKSTYLDLQEVLAINGIRTMQAETTLALPALATEIADTGGPPVLPADLIVPHGLWERGTGTTERFQPMDEAVDRLPDIDPRIRLQWWQWQENKLKFIGATRSVDILLKYEKQLADLVDASSNILIRGGKNALAYMTAAIIARSRGVQGLVGDMAGQANAQIEQLITRNTKPKQRTAVRRRPYGWRRRLVYM